MLINKLKIGQTVWTLRGVGEVIRVSCYTGLHYPITVRVHGVGELTFTREGKFQTNDLYPTLWLNDSAPWPNPEPPRSLPQRGDRVEILQYGRHWIRRYATGDNKPGGEIGTFPDGRDEWTVPSDWDPSYWADWRYPE